jgi:hypothetical protein
MEAFFLAALLRPLVALVFRALIGVPVRLAVQRFMKDGALKRALLTRIGES